MTNRSFNTNYTSGVSPSGFWRAEVVAIDGNLLSIKIPRLAMNNIYEKVQYIGFAPSVGDRVWAAFIEGNSANPVVLAGANEVDSDITDIVAGVALSGGGSSGTVTLDFEPSELTTVSLDYDDKIVISDASDSDEPKLVSMADIVTVVHGDGGGEPIGHANKADSAISFDYSSRVFTISPVGDSYEVWCKGKKFVKTEAETVTIGTSSDLYYISFDADGVLQAKTTFFVWDSETPTAYIYFNANEPEKYMLFDERHGIVLDWQTHEYLHRTRGAAFANGFKVDFSGNDGSLPAAGDDAEDAQIDLQNSDDPLSTAIGTFFDEDLQVDIVHSNTPTANTWEQDLQGPARIPVFYLTDDGWTYDSPTDYPVKNGSSHATYNLYSTGTWSTPDIGANQYGIYWIVATNQLNYPVISIMGQGQYANVGEAEAITWDSMTLTDLPIVELRVLYKIIFRATGSNVPGCYFEQIDDFRVAATASSAGTTVSDHGSLTGLGDDDHPQYGVAGSDGYVQYNNAGLFGGVSSFTFNDATGRLTVGGDLYFQNNALVAADAGSSNIDHIWHNDTTNSWNFCSDTTYKAAGNSTLTAGSFSGSGASLTSLNASNLASGTVPNDRISGAYSGITSLTATDVYATNFIALQTSGAALTVKDTNTADASGYIKFVDSGDVQLGYIGYGNNDDIHIKNENTGGAIYFATENTWRAEFTTAGHFEPYIDSAYNLGSNTVRWANAYADNFIGGGGSITGVNATLLDGLDLHTGRNNEANKVVRTDGNGYIQAGWINTTSGATTSTIDRIYASNDAYVRYVTPATFRSQVITGNAIYPSTVDAGYILVSKSGTSSAYTAQHLQLFNPTNSTNSVSGLTFHIAGQLAPVFRSWPGTGAGFDAGNQAGTGYTFLGASSFPVRSSRRLKKNIVQKSDEEVIPSILNALSVRTVVFDDDFNDGYWCEEEQCFKEHELCDCEDCEDCNAVRNDPLQRKHFKRRGMIAEELEEVFPEAVHLDIDGIPIGIDYAVITVELLDAVKLLVLQCENQERRIAELEASIA